MTDMFLPPSLSKARSARSQGRGPGDPSAEGTRRSWPRPRDSGPLPADSGARTGHGRRGSLPHSPWSAGRRRCPRRSSGRQGSQPRSAPGAGSCLRLIPATDAASGSCPGSAAASLPPSLRGGGRSWAATEAATGARSRSRSAGARSSSRALAGKARRGRAAERAQRRARPRTCHSQREAQVKLGSTQGPKSRADSQASRAVASTHFLWARGGWSWRIPVAQAARARLHRLTCPFPAPVPVTPTGLCRSLRVAKSLQPKYREASRDEEGYCGKGRTFFTSLQISKWLRKRLV